MIFNQVLSYKNLPIFHFSEQIKKDFPNKRLKGVIFGNFGALNYGDEAILAGQLQELQNIKDCQITVISRFPDQVKRIHKTKAIGTTDITKIVTTLAKANFVIVGGGGLFCKNDGGLKGLLFQIYTATFFLLYPMILRKKVYALGIGIYSNMPNILKPLVLQLLQHASFVTVRDAHSYEFLTSKNNPVKFYKDNSFLMDLALKKDIASEEIIKANMHKKKYHVGFALKRPDSQKERDRLAQEILSFMKENAHDTAFWFYSLDANVGYNNDKAFNDELISSLEDTDSYTIIKVPTELHPAKLFSFFQYMDFMITMRLHASIFCYRLIIPFYSITYDTKCSSFLDSIGHEKHEIINISAKKMQEEFEKIKISNI